MIYSPAVGTYFNAADVNWQYSDSSSFYNDPWVCADGSTWALYTPANCSWIVGSNGESCNAEENSTPSEPQIAQFLTLPPETETIPSNGCESSITTPASSSYQEYIPASANIVYEQEFISEESSSSITVIQPQFVSAESTESELQGPLFVENSESEIQEPQLENIEFEVQEPYSNLEAEELPLEESTADSEVEELYFETEVQEPYTSAEWEVSESYAAWKAEEPSTEWEVREPYSAWVVEESSAEREVEEPYSEWELEEAYIAWNTEESSAEWEVQEPYSEWQAQESYAEWKAEEPYSEWELQEQYLENSAWEEQESYLENAEWEAQEAYLENTAWQIQPPTETVEWEFQVPVENVEFQVQPSEKNIEFQIQSIEGIEQPPAENFEFKVQTPVENAEVQLQSTESIEQQEQLLEENVESQVKPPQVGYEWQEQSPAISSEEKVYEESVVPENQESTFTVQSLEIEVESEESTPLFSQNQLEPCGCESENETSVTLQESSIVSNPAIAAELIHGNSGGTGLVYYDQVTTITNITTEKIYYPNGYIETITYNDETVVDIEITPSSVNEASYTQNSVIINGEMVGNSNDDHVVKIGPNPTPKQHVLTMGSCQANTPSDVVEVIPESSSIVETIQDSPSDGEEIDNDPGYLFWQGM
ncbi:unnamed protein product [Sphagnum balticum]